jgi:2,4-dienoyl-CoA reductase-like NADH-dependent reductase (Old Yellow Enzyme family)
MSMSLSSSASPSAAHPVLLPGQLGSLSLPNRAVVAPMSRVSAAESGVPTGQMARYYARFAAGGFAAVITEGIYTDTSFAQAYARQPGLVSEEQAVGWQPVTAAIHAHGTVAIAQLMHAGALSQHLKRTAAPSAVRPRGHKLRGYGGDGDFGTPMAMGTADIEVAVDGFAQSALRAFAAGFDGIEVHAANGYLLDQFITRYTNIRTDRYGGTAADRARLTAEVVTAIKAATAGIAPAFIVGVRLSQTKVNDFEYRWGGRAEAAAYAALSPAPRRGDGRRCPRVVVRRNRRLRAALGQQEGTAVHAGR